MCGLVGALAFEDTSSEELSASVRDLTARMVRRGPDDEGLWSDDRCALGFRRLSILDLSPAGHQPMVSEDKRRVMVFNGEIYNFREIRDELAQRGRRPRSTGDAEVLLLALEEWGESALSRLNGMFAVALYDREQRNVLLARDHVGIKPLYYGLNQRGLVFGSQYDQVLAHRWFRGARPDPSMVGLYLRFGFLPAPFALHENTGQLEAGEWLRISDRRVVKRGRFFDLPQNQRPTLRGNEAIDSLDAVLGAAVKRHMVADVPVGVLLSGGIDSPLVAAEAAGQLQHLQSFTIGTEDEGDESADAARYGDELGLQRFTRRITSSDALRLVDDVIAASTEPTADFSMFPMLLVSQLAREHVKVVLSGDGGDELLWGYPSRFVSAVGQAPYFAWPTLLRYGAVAARRYLKKGSATREVLAHHSLGELYQRKHTLLPPQDLASIFPALPSIPHTFDAFHSTATSSDEAAQWVRWNELTIHLARVLAKVDRASMFHSLEVRVPLLDKEFVETAWRVDWRSCLDLKSRRGKLPLRALLARRVRHQTSAKRGFTVPMSDWLVGPLRPLLAEHLFARKDLLGVPVRSSSIKSMVQALERGDRSKAWGLWLLLSLSMWERKYGVAG